MRYSYVTTSENNKAKCFECKEPIIKREGMSVWNNVRKLCYKCSIKRFEEYINFWKRQLKDLKKSNHRSLKKMNEVKISRML